MRSADFSHRKGSLDQRPRPTREPVVAFGGSRRVIILLNGPLGVGKSSLGEALMEALPHSAHLDGDALVATNPPVPANPGGRDRLHGAIERMVTYHLQFGIHHFVISHVWFDAQDLRDLMDRLLGCAPGAQVHCFRLCLDAEANLERIERRARGRALDELACERRTVRDERSRLAGRKDLGERFDVTRPVDDLVGDLLLRVG